MYMYISSIPDHGVTGHKFFTKFFAQSLTMYQRTDMDEKIAMGQAMGQNLTNDLVKKYTRFDIHLTVGITPSLLSGHWE